VAVFAHTPVMVAEVLAALRPKDGQQFADGSVGGGGHAEAVLKASAPTGWLSGCDRDGEAIEAAQARLAGFAGRFELRQANFAEMDAWIKPGSCDGVLLDLGVSSWQLDEPARGFSFQQDGPLDMRQDRRQALTAAELVNTASAEELARIFWEYGDERQSRRLAGAIVEERRARAFRTTRQLAGLIERLSPRRGRRTHPATQVFQALRIAVNDELKALRSGLEAAVRILKPGGRLAVITFHSLEDRLVKQFGRERTRDYTVAGEVDVPELRQPCRPELEWVQRKAIAPGPAELAANPRSRSSQLRILQKVS
jgi:16S rRNA (cytosine1402-N4)-methyltransferase